VLTSDHIEGVAGAIIGKNPRLLQDMADHGSCDCSYALKNFCRFRVNIFRQNGNYAMVMRRLQAQIPTLDSLHLPPVFREVIKEKNGLIFVTGATGSGKTTTLAAMLNGINQTSDVHIITLEDPIEFLHPHLKATFSQRELGRDFYSFPDGLRAACGRRPRSSSSAKFATANHGYCAHGRGNRTRGFQHPAHHQRGTDDPAHPGHVHAGRGQQVRERLVGSCVTSSASAWFPERTVGGCWSPS